MSFPIWLPRSSSFLPASCSRMCQKIVLGTAGFEDFGFLIHVAHFRNAEIAVLCYLFIYLLVCRNSLKILAHVYFRFIKVNFPFTNGEGKRRKLSFPSTVDNFRDTFRSPRYSFIASYDAKNELKTYPCGRKRVQSYQLFISSFCSLTITNLRKQQALKAATSKSNEGRI